MRLSRTRDLLNAVAVNDFELASANQSALQAAQVRAAWYARFEGMGAKVKMHAPGYAAPSGCAVGSTHLPQFSPSGFLTGTRERRSAFREVRRTVERLKCSRKATNAPSATMDPPSAGRMAASLDHPDNLLLSCKGG